MDVEEYYEALRNVIRAEPDIVIDDGADLIFLLHGEMESYAEKVKGQARKRRRE